MSSSNPGAVNRRTFVKDAALAAGAASGLSVRLGALSGLLAQPRPSSLPSRPFNMICLGDSVMWGQGLEESTKFTWLVKTWLESKLPGRPVNRFVFARSGATIAPDPEAPESGVKDWMNNRMLGEVPCSWPWVQQQVVVAGKEMASLRIAADAVDLVLVDGGINDIRVFTLLNAGKSSAEIREKSAEFCGRQMADVLGRIRNAFPTAKILVTGYFPIVTEETDLQALGVLLALLLPVAGAALTPVIRTKLAELSATWYQASNADLAGAVASFNATRGSTSKTPPAAFARIPWGAEHSYAASNPRLYLAGLPNDPVYWQRLSQCASAGPGKAGSPLCLDAKVGHPNTAGAAAYADACKAQLGQYLHEWGGAKLMSACVEMDPMPAVGVATTLTVHASADGPTGRMTVPATVHVGGETFPTGRPVPLTLCTSRTVSSVDREGRRVRKEEIVTGVNCAPLTVSASGYADVVIRDYLNAQPIPR